MSLTKTLRAEHAELLRLAGKYAALIARPTPPAAAELRDLRQLFAKKLLAHLMQEDWVLYPALQKSPDARTVAIARSFVEEMGGLVDAFRQWSSRWTVAAATADWPGFCNETRGLLTALELRIRRENRELYPLLEAGVAKAA